MRELGVSVGDVRLLVGDGDEHVAQAAQALVDCARLPAPEPCARVFGPIKIGKNNSAHAKEARPSLNLSTLRGTLQANVDTTKPARQG